MNEKAISATVIRRLPRYYRYLSELLENDVERISSKELSDRMNVTASQIRQDFNNFGGFGQQGYGYNVKYLHSEIGKILGLEKTHNVVIVGAGNLGQALAKYQDFPKRGFKIIGIFDIDPKKIGMKIGGVEIKNMAELENFIKDNDVDIAAITLPKEPAPAIAAALAELGVKAIWNFAPTDLHLEKDVIVENVHLLESLMHVSYRLADRERGDDDDDDDDDDDEDDD